jgi:DNA-binding response OmpR family regulator
VESPDLALTSSTAAAPLVLIVDDDVDSCEMYAMCVKAAGLRVAQAHDGASGLARALESEPDLLVTDIVMPGLDGFELTRRVRDTATMRGLPVIAVTARTITDADLTRLYHGGPTTVLLTPCEPISLLVEIWNLLRDSEALRARATALVERSAAARARAFQTYGKSVVHHERSLTLVASRRTRETERILEGFMKLPGLRITPADAARLWSIDEPSCEELLDSMVEEGFLVYAAGRYHRA